MNRAKPSVAALAFLLTLPAIAAGASVSLVSSANPAVFGAPVTLTATVSPSAATGKVTFYDGKAVLGTAPLIGGSARLSVPLNVTGTRSLVARYLGDGQNASALSAPASVTVNSVSSFGFKSSSFDPGFIASETAVGDFNNDGIPDAVAVGGGNLVKVFPGNGDGTFGPVIATLFPLDATILSLVTVADFNLDGNQDVALVNNQQNNVAVFFGNGNGTFSGAVSLPTAAGQILVADFNGDGVSDLAVAHSTSVGVLLGHGDGTFATPAEYPFAPFLYNMAVADVNNDGTLDLVTVVPPTRSDSREVVVLLGNGSGSFSGPIDALDFFFFYNPDDSYDLVDVNGDAKLDLVWAPGYGNHVGIMFGNGDGTFAQPIFYPVSNNGLGVGGATGIAVIDVDGDGILDVLVERALSGAGLTQNSLAIYKGVGDGTFRPLGVSSIALSALNGLGAHMSLATADFNHDGRIDIAAVSALGPIVILEGGALPLLHTAITDSGNFAPGQSGATFTITVGNIGGSATAGPVTLTPGTGGGMDAVSVAGAGWVCDSSCTRSDSIAPGASYPPVTITVNVQANQSHALLLQNAVVFGGGSSVTSETWDAAAVQFAGPPSAPVLLAPANGLLALGVQFQWEATAETISYEIYLGTSPNPPLMAANVDPTTTRAEPSQDLSFSQVYYWRVVAKNSAGSSSSPTWSFRTPPPPGTVNTQVGLFRASAFMTAEDVNGNLTWDPGADRALFFGMPGDVLIKGDWDGSGRTKLGIFRPSVAMFALDINGNGIWDPGIDVYGFFGQSGDVPIVGDWTGDGKTKIGIYRPSTSLFALDLNNNLAWDPGSDAAGQYGVAGDVPIVGDWTGSGTTKIGIYRPSSSLFALDVNGNLEWDSGIDAAGVFGVAGDTPIVGDWTGTGTTKAGIYRSATSLFALDSNGNLAWDPGTDKAGVFGAPGDLWVVGDWGGVGITRIGIYRPSSGLWGLDLNGNLAWDLGVDLGGVFGGAGDVPFVGHW